MSETPHTDQRWNRKRIILLTVAGVAAFAVAAALFFYFKRTPPSEPTATLERLASSHAHVETAKLISHITEGVVSRYAQVAVRFASVHAEREQDARALAAAFTLVPAVDGEVRWVDERTVAFQPRTPLSAGARYSCIFDVAKALPSEKNAKPFAFEIEAARNEVSVKADFELAKPDDPRQMVYKGRMEFTDKVEFDDLEAHAAFTEGGRALALSWRGDTEQKAFLFESEPITRTEATRQFVLSIKGQPFALKEDFRHETALPAMGDLGIVGADLYDEAREMRIGLQFSDPLPESAALDGYVALEPFLQAKTTVSGRTLLVSADFERGKAYKLTVRPGISSRWGTKLKTEYVRNVTFENLKPEIAFSQTGAFLPTSSNRVIAFRAVNVRKVKAVVTEVFESNLGWFLQDNDLASSKTRCEVSGNMRRVGLEVASMDLDLGEVKNKWVQSEIDLSKLLQGKERGLFLVTLSFTRKDILYECRRRQPRAGREVAEDDYDYYEYSDYYSDPCSSGYYYDRARVVKPIIVSDIGLLAKQSGTELLVAATHLQTAKPLPGVQLTLWSYQNQPLETGTTDVNGMATFGKKDGFYVEGRWSGQRAALKFGESALNTSGFDVGGDAGTSKATRAFVYADRGVHRPGDPAYLSVIVRNQDGKFPSGHPIGMKIRNPKNQLVHEEVNKDGVDGHYAFVHRTADTAMTGRWSAEFYNGKDMLASHTVRVETVVPNRLKVLLDAPTAALGPKDRKHEPLLRSNYLFGTPAAGLRGEVGVRYLDATKTFPGYEDYLFRHPAVKFKDDEKKLFEGILDSSGTARLTWEIPDFSQAPSSVSAALTARVFEKGGRATTQVTSVEVDPYDVYVGLLMPSEHYVKLQKAMDFSILALDRGGRPAEGRKLQVRVYRNGRYWWWEYDSRQDFQLRFKTDVNTQLVKSAVLTSSGKPVNFSFAPSDWGRHLIEIQDGDSGHATGYFFWASSWGEEAAPLAAGTQLEIQSDRQAYHPGETAKLAAKTPAEGMAFVSVEKGDRILSTRWLALRGAKTEFDIPITADMLPNAYVHVTAIQPHAQTTNDRPMRLYGVLPLRVEEASTRLSLEVDVPSELKPRAAFEVKVRTTDARPATLTVAVVDEGLLDLTSFKTPDPWAFFYQKEKLSVLSYDLFDNVIGVVWGDIYKRFVLTGGDEAFRAKQRGAIKAKRFEPVSLYAGPIKTDAKGRASVSFTMPNYMGSVRVMAAAASGTAYGHAEQAVPVREPLMILPSLPRVLGAAESCVLPVTVFALEDGMGRVDVTVSVEGPLRVEGATTQSMEFSQKGDKETIFRLSAEKAVGTAKIRITAKSAKHQTFAETELAVRAVNPSVHESQQLAVEPNQSAEITVPEVGIKGTGKASLKISAMSNLKFGHRLQFLMRYPYGCIEQTTSSVFPQLYLKDFVAALDKPSYEQHETTHRVDRNINAAIDRLRGFLMPNGGFSFWPSGSDYSDWGTNYAGHFLIEAKRRGYHVPDGMFGGWLAHQKEMAAKESGHQRARAYRLYLLALAGEPQLGPMNLMKEERLSTLDTASKWYLAAAYHLSGSATAAREILKGAGADITDYREQGGTLGSGFRDKAILLELATLMGEKTTALRLFEELNTALGQKTGYYSTQETGYSLLAVGKYLEAAWQKDAVVKGQIDIPGASPLKFNVKGEMATFDMTPHFGKKITVRSSSARPIYAVFDWEGVPLESPSEKVERNMNLTVSWLDEDGKPIDPAKIKQGTYFWCRIHLDRQHRGTLENVALTQIFPAGWEIENTRLSGEAIPVWAQYFYLNRETYMDIRDDRVMWFLDMSSGMDFLVKLLAVTPGRYFLAPTYAEAMYDQEYRALEPGKAVEVVE